MPYYTVLQMKNSARHFSAMNPVIMENVGEKDEKAKEKPYCAITIIVT